MKARAGKRGTGRGWEKGAFKTGKRRKKNRGSAGNRERRAECRIFLRVRHGAKYSVTCTRSPRFFKATSARRQ